MFTKKFSEKHLRLGARTWRPPDRDEIYRKLYLASSVIDPSQYTTPSIPIDPEPPLSIHDPPPAHDPLAPPTRSRSTSLHQPSTAHSHQSQYRNLDGASLRSRSQSQKAQGYSPQRRASIASESLKASHIPAQSVRSDPHSRHEPIGHPDPHFSQNLLTPQLTHLATPSDRYQLDSASRNARQSQKEYAESCIQSDYCRELLKERQQEYELAKERWMKARNAVELNDPTRKSVIDDHNLSDPGVVLKYNNPELNKTLESNNNLPLVHTLPTINDYELGNTPAHSNHQLLHTPSHNNYEPSNTPVHNPEFHDTPKHRHSEPSTHQVSENLLQQAQEVELHEQRLKQIQEQTREQAEIHEQKLKEIREMDSLLAIKEQQVEMRVKQLEEALEVERLKCQEYTMKAKQLEEALEAEQIKCQERIKSAQEEADRAAHESIQRVKEERQRKFEEFQKQAEEKQQLTRQEYEAECERLRQAQIQLETKRKEEKRRETEARMLSQMEKFNHEDQVQPDLQAQAIAQKERDKLAMRAQIQERHHKKPLVNPDQRRAELIASFQPIAMWYFDPHPGYLPPPYLPPSFPPTPMSPRIVPEAVKKAASAQKQYHEKLEQKKAEEQARTLKQRELHEQELMRLELERRRAQQHSTPGQFNQKHNPARFRSGSFNGRNVTPNVDEPLTRSARSSHLRYHPNSNFGSQAQPSDMTRSNQQDDNRPILARGREPDGLEGFAQNSEQNRGAGNQSFNVTEPLTRSTRSPNFSSNPTANHESQSHSTDKTRTSQPQDDLSIEARKRGLEELARRHEQLKRIEDAVLAKNRATLENAARQAKASENSKARSSRSQRAEDSSESQIRAAELAAHFMAEQASSRLSRRKTPQIHNPSNSQTTSHDNPNNYQTTSHNYPPLNPDTTSAPPFEHPPHSGVACQAYSTDFVPGYDHEVVEPIESSVVLLVEHPYPIDFLDNDPGGNEFKFQSNQLARRELIIKAEDIGAGAIIGLNHPPPVMVDHTRVNFSAKGIAVVLKDPSMGRAEHYDPHPLEFNEQPYPSPDQRKHPNPYSNKVTDTPGSIPFGYQQSEKSQSPPESPSPKNWEEQRSNKNVPRNGLESSIPLYNNHNNPGHKSPGHLQHRNHRSPRVIQEENHYIKPEAMSSQLPDPPVLVTPKLTLQSPSEKSSLNEPKENVNFSQQDHYGTSSPAPTQRSNSRPAGSPKTNSQKPERQGGNPVSSSAKISVNWNPPSPRADSTTDFRDSNRATSSWDHSVSPTDLGSASYVTNTDGVKETESKTSLPYQNSPATLPRSPAFRAMPTIAESDRSIEKRAVQPSHPPQKSPLNSSTIPSSIPRYNWGNSLDEDKDSYKVSWSPENQEHKRSSSRSSMAKPHYGKSDSTHTVQFKEHQERNENSRTQEAVLTNNLIRSNRTLVNHSDLPEQSQQDKKQSFINVHSSPLEKRCTDSDVSTATTHNQDHTLKKHNERTPNRDQAFRVKKQGNNTQVVGPHHEKQKTTVIPSQKTQKKDSMTRSPTEPVTSPKPHAVVEKARERSPQTEINLTSTMTESQLNSLTEVAAPPESCIVNKSNQVPSQIPKQKKQRNNPINVDEPKKSMLKSITSSEPPGTEVSSIAANMNTSEVQDGIDSASTASDCASQPAKPETKSETKVSFQSTSEHKDSNKEDSTVEISVPSSPSSQRTVRHMEGVQPSSATTKVHASKKKRQRNINKSDLSEKDKQSSTSSEQTSSSQHGSAQRSPSTMEAGPNEMISNRLSPSFEHVPTTRSELLETLMKRLDQNYSPASTSSTTRQNKEPANRIVQHSMSPENLSNLDNLSPKKDQSTDQEEKGAAKSPLSVPSQSQENPPPNFKIRSETVSPSKTKSSPLVAPVLSPPISSKLLNDQKSSPALPFETPSPLLASTVEYLLSRSSRSTTPFHFGTTSPAHLNNLPSSSPVIPSSRKLSGLIPSSVKSPPNSSVHIPSSSKSSPNSSAPITSLIKSPLNSSVHIPSSIKSPSNSSKQDMTCDAKQSGSVDYLTDDEAALELQNPLSRPIIPVPSSLVHHHVPTDTHHKSPSYQKSTPYFTTSPCEIGSSTFATDTDLWDFSLLE